MGKGGGHDALWYWCTWGNYRWKNGTLIMQILCCLVLYRAWRNVNGNAGFDTVYVWGSAFLQKNILLINFHRYVWCWNDVVIVWWRLTFVSVSADIRAFGMACDSAESNTVICKRNRMLKSLSMAPRTNKADCIQTQFNQTARTKREWERERERERERSEHKENTHTHV